MNHISSLMSTHQFTLLKLALLHTLVTNSLISGSEILSHPDGGHIFGLAIFFDFSLFFFMNNLFTSNRWNEGFATLLEVIGTDLVSLGFNICLSRKFEQFRFYTTITEPIIRLKYKI